MSYFQPYIDGTGIHMPTYEDRLQDLCDAYRSIFGQDAELTPAVPDYQLLSVLAKALDDTSALVLSAYNSRNPAYASGQGLDLLLPQYGILREEGETDASVRARMNLAMASRGIFTFDAMEAALRGISGVTHVMFRVNDEDSAVDGIPGHTLALYISGGNANAIAQVLWDKKPPGLATTGTLSRTVTDEKGNSHTVKFSRVTLLPIHYRIQLRKYDGYDADTIEPAMKHALFQFTNYDLGIGEAINVPQLYGMLYQAAGNLASTFAITDLYISGAHGIEREKLTPEWNKKYTLTSTAEVIISDADE